MCCLKRRLRNILVATSLAAALLLGSPEIPYANADSYSQITGRKVIQLGWDIATPEILQQQSADLEKWPLDGVTICLPEKASYVFNSQQWEEKKARIGNQAAIMSSLKWNKFTDNFMVMYSASSMDWFSDSDWKIVLDNAAYIAKTARAGNCKGLLFDTEPYPHVVPGTRNPWRYAQQKNEDKISYEDYCAKVRQRGSQFMRTIEKEFPNVKMFHLQFFSLFQYRTDAYDEKLRHEQVKGYEDWNLYLSFITGMLEAAGPEVQFIDGNLPSYYYTQTYEFWRGYWMMKNNASVLVPMELKEKFRNQVRASFALFADNSFDGIISGFQKHMSQDERAKMFTYQAYESLQMTDEYVWLYTERMNWRSGQNLPPGIDQAIIDAKKSQATRVPLGYSRDDTNRYMEAATAKMKQAQ
jgi:hypothetical protein